MMAGRAPKYSNSSSTSASNKTQLPAIPLGVVPVPKVAIRRPPTILKVEHLTSKKGIACLPDILAEAKFKGKGHELEDLRMLLSKSKHWAHRLFPKVTFEDFVERAEALGSKNSVKNYLTRIRHGMPLHFGEELVVSDNEDGEEGNEVELADQEMPEKEEEEDSETPANTGSSELKFDRLFREFSSLSEGRAEEEDKNELPKRDSEEEDHQLTSRQQQQLQSSQTPNLTTKIEQVSSQLPKHQQPSVEEFAMDDMDDDDYDEDFLSSFKP